jgi:hypothetical protein
MVAVHRLDDLVMISTVADQQTSKPDLRSSTALIRELGERIGKWNAEMEKWPQGSLERASAYGATVGLSEAQSVIASQVTAAIQESSNG